MCLRPLSPDYNAVPHGHSLCGGREKSGKKEGDWPGGRDKEKRRGRRLRKLFHGQFQRANLSDQHSNITPNPTPGLRGACSCWWVWPCFTTTLLAVPSQAVGGESENSSHSVIWPLRPPWAVRLTCWNSPGCSSGMLQPRIKPRSPYVQAGATMRHN